VSYTLPINEITNALVDAVAALVGQMGETVTYTYHDGTTPVTVRAVRQKITEEDLVGDYEQGDCKFTFDATTLPKAPAKYDTILAGDGLTYTVVDHISTDKGINNTKLVYIPVGRA